MTSKQAKIKGHTFVSGQAQQIFFFLGDSSGVDFDKNGT
jgi:hypothetical protein